MDVVGPVLGALIILTTMADFAWTTLTARGAGPLTRMVSRGLWRLALRLDSVFRRNGFRSLTGPAILLATLVCWFSLTWLGWTLIFLADPAAVVDSSTREAADFWSRLYFVGFTITDLGVGDYAPRGPLWQVLTVVAALTGLMQITLAVTYLVSVLSSVTGQRALAVQITGLGSSPEEILIRAWDGQQFAALSQVLATLGPQLATQTQRQKAFPITRYFFSADPRTANALAMALLDEGLLLLSRAVAPEKRPPVLLIEAVRQVIGMVAEPPEGVEQRSAPRQPPLPDPDRLAEAGIPVVGDLGGRMADEDRRRRHRLLELVEAQGWAWDDVGRPWRGGAPGGA